MPGLKDSPDVGRDDAVSVLEVAVASLRHWRMIIVLPVTLALIAGSWAYTRERQYVATASLVPTGGDARGGGGAAALAQQFGLNISGDRSGGSPMFIMDLLKSRALLRQAVEATYVIPREGGPWRGNLIQYWGIQPQGPAPAWLRAVDQLRHAVNAAVNRETGMVVFSVAADHQELSEQIASKLLVILNEVDLKIRQGRALEEGRFIRGLVAEAEQELVRAEIAQRDFLRRNRQYHSAPELVLEHERLQRSVLMRQEIYTAVRRSQEQARADAIRDTPLFAVIDRPEDSAVPQGRGTIAKAVSGFVVGFLLALLIAVVREFMNRKRPLNSPEGDEFRRLLGQVRRDIRRPTRWVKSGSGTTAASSD